MDGSAGGATRLRIDGRRSISLSELEFEAVRSSGPGGQNVNKVSTKVTVVFRPATSPSLDEEARARLVTALGSRLTSDGALRVTCGRTRSQARNREEAMAKLAAILAAALAPRKRRRPTRPTRASREERLSQKKRRATRKESRRWSPED